MSLNEIRKIREAKQKYTKCVGYIGKLGLRLDAELIDGVTSACPEILFVFVGGYLKGQINEKLIKIFENRDNVLHIDAVPSAFVYSILNEFDVLSIPHAVGKAENGGDPLKLYQYLTRNKPIITTDVGGMRDQFIDKETALIVNGEVDDIYKAVKSLIEDDKYRQKLILNLKQKNYEFDGYIKQYEKLFN